MRLRLTDGSVVPAIVGRFDVGRLAGDPNLVSNSVVGYVTA